MSGPHKTSRKGKARPVPRVGRAVRDDGGKPSLQMPFIMRCVDVIMGNNASVVLAHPSPSSTRSLIAHTGE